MTLTCYARMRRMYGIFTYVLFKSMVNVVKYAHIEHVGGVHPNTFRIFDA